MGEYVKVTVSLPRTLLAATQRLQVERGENRSQFFRHALDHLLREEQQRQLVERYVRGYLECPETPEELSIGDVLIQEVAKEVPWDAAE